MNIILRSDATPAGAAAAPMPTAPFPARRSARAAAAAVASSAVSLAFFLSRKPTGLSPRHHAKFRA